MKCFCKWFSQWRDKDRSGGGGGGRGVDGFNRLPVSVHTNVANEIDRVLRTDSG